MKKKIIFVSKALWIGGIETALVNLLNHIDYGKFDVTCLVLKAELNMADRINPKCRLLVIDREKKVSFDKDYQYKKLYHLTEESTNPSRLHKLFMGTVPVIKWIENRLYIRYIRELMKEEKFDTAVVYSDVVAESTIRAIRAKKYLMFYHHGAMRHVYHDEIGYKKCEKIIAVSENQANALREFVPQYADKITVIHNLTDVDGLRKKAEMPMKDKFEKEYINIVSCGRVSHEKGMDIAVKACAELVKRGFENIRWWIVGGGPAEQEVKDIIAELHMEEQIKMVGMKSNPYPYIKQADLYVQPSRFEAFGLTIKEAMILRKRIVSTNTDGARELITCNEEGVLCEADHIMLATAIEKEKKKKLGDKNIDAERFEEENRDLMRKLEAIW